MTRAKQTNICLITLSSPQFRRKEPDVVLQQFLQVLEPIGKELFFLTDNYPSSAIFSSKIHLWKIKKYRKKDHLLLRIADHIITQLRISYRLAKIANRINIVVFVGTTILLLPMLVARLFHKKTVYISVGFIAGAVGELYKDITFGSTLTLIIATLENLHYKLSDRAVIYSQRCLTPDLLKYKDKIWSAPRHFLDFEKFKLRKRLRERENVIGYIGRLHPEKGILNFMEAISMILKARKDVTFLVVGDGELREKVEEYLKRGDLNNKVRYIRWVSHDKIPKYLNDLKLCVLPSAPTEGLPNIMLEAMACGTPFLATPVGAIPDVIKDGETGFIMKDNSPECIARNVIRALDHSHLERITQNARAFVKREYTYEAAMGRYRNLLLHQPSKTINKSRNSWVS
jgi:glycosyltransferase involved in cell wall biosynthesis